MDEKAIVGRIDALLDLPKVSGEPALRARPGEISSGTLTLLVAVCGETGPQVEAFKESISVARREAGFHALLAVTETSCGALKNLKSEIALGLIGSLARTVSGEVLSDFIQLAKAALENKGDPAKNVAAVLAAAAFEDTIRRMGTSFTGVVTRDDLQTIISELKKRGILQGSQVGVVQSHLQFRNDALHADWDKIDRVSVNTALELVEHLLLKHFP